MLERERHIHMLRYHDNHRLTSSLPSSKVLSLPPERTNILALFYLLDLQYIIWFYIVYFCCCTMLMLMFISIRRYGTCYPDQSSSPLYELPLLFVSVRHKLALSYLSSYRTKQHSHKLFFLERETSHTINIKCCSGYQFFAVYCSIVLQFVLQLR